MLWSRPSGYQFHQRFLFNFEGNSISPETKFWCNIRHSCCVLCNPSHSPATCLCIDVLTLPFEGIIVLVKWNNNCCDLGQAATNFIKDFCSISREIPFRPKQNSDVIFAIAATSCATPNSKVHRAKIGPTWILSAPCGPHFGPINLAARDIQGPNFLDKFCYRSYIQRECHSVLAKLHPVTFYRIIFGECAVPGLNATFCFLWFTNCVLLFDKSLILGCLWPLVFVLNNILILGIWCSTIPHLPWCFSPWTFFENIGFNTVLTDPFMSHLATQLGYSAGEFQALQLIVLAAFGVVD